MYDIFISFKHHDEFGMVTRDFHIAQELYSKLLEKNYNPFFSNESIKKQGHGLYKNVIDRALEESRILIVVGTSADNIKSSYVTYEWNTFINERISGRKKDAEIFTLVDGINICDLPLSLRQTEVLDFAQGGLEILIDFISNIKKESSRASLKTTGSSYSYVDIGEKERLMTQASLESKMDYKLISENLDAVHKKGVSVLDVGCSSGFVTKTVFQQFENIHKVIGIDKFSECIDDFEKDIDDERFAGYCVDCESVDFEEILCQIMKENNVTGFDVIFSALCIHHLSNPKSVLKTLKKYLNKGGILYIRTCDDGQDIAYPDENNLISNLITESMKIKGMSDRFHGRKMLSHLLKIGFNNIKTYNYCIDTVNKTNKDRYCLYCNSFAWRKNYYRRQLDDDNGSNPETLKHFADVCNALDEIEERFYDNNFYYCYNIPIFIAKKEF